MKKPLKIAFTGGGSSGHITPNLSIIKRLQQDGARIYYIGGRNSLEKELIEEAQISFYAIFCGKLRRYFSWQNFIDPFKIVLGFCQAFFILLFDRPQVVFSKGGFVAFPVVTAAWLLRIPVIVHESDLTPGLANRLCFPFAAKICTSFSETKQYIRYKNKITHTGTPLRAELQHPNLQAAKQLCQFNNAKQIILVVGGGLGAHAINQKIRAALLQLLPEFNLIHLCGKGKVEESLRDKKGYLQFEYLNENYVDMVALADLVVSRAGANSVYELLALKKLVIFVPLPRSKSRGEQIVNANHFTQQGLSTVLPEEQLTTETLFLKIKEVLHNAPALQQHLAAYTCLDGTDTIAKLLQVYAK